ncbi:hypothetical protein [Vibrio nigripulchritudo]|nr:hypothetical protein [Vibrio nigripulchritudo]
MEWMLPTKWWHLWNKWSNVMNRDISEKALNYLLADNLEGYKSHHPFVKASWLDDVLLSIQMSADCCTEYLSQQGSVRDELEYELIMQQSIKTRNAFACGLWISKEPLYFQMRFFENASKEEISFLITEVYPHVEHADFVLSECGVRWQEYSKEIKQWLNSVFSCPSAVQDAIERMVSVDGLVNESELAYFLNLQYSNNVDLFDQFDFLIKTLPTDEKGAWVESALLEVMFNNQRDCFADHHGFYERLPMTLVKKAYQSDPNLPFWYNNIPLLAKLIEENDEIANAALNHEDFNACADSEAEKCWQYTILYMLIENKCLHALVKLKSLYQGRYNFWGKAGKCFFEEDSNKILPQLQKYGLVSREERDRFQC